MKRIFCHIIIYFCLCFTSTAQEILISDQLGRLYTLDVSSCQVSDQVITDADVKDISYLPDGRLIGISGVGELWEIDPATGTTLLLHQFGAPIGGIYNSLTADADGVIYTTGTAGELNSYDIRDGIERFIGVLPFGATGDLTFSNNDLYVAADLDKILKVDLEFPELSETLITADSNTPIFGIVTDVEICNVAQTFAISGGDENIVFTIDFESRELIQRCVIDFSIPGDISDFEVFGGASINEYRASAFLSIDDIIVNNPECCGDPGSIEVMASGGDGLITYSVDNGAFNDRAVIENIPVGSHTLLIMDALGCVIQGEFEIRPGEQIMMEPLTFDFVNITPADCFGDNGRIQAAITGSGTQATGSGSIFFNNAAFGTVIDIEVDVGLYTLSATDGGSTRIDSLLTVESEGCDIYIPNVISNNSVQGNNNRFIIFAEEGLNPTILTYQIFDRWGNKMYERFNLPTTQFSEWWDGTCNGSPCEQDVYSYFVEIDLGRGNIEERAGTVLYLK